MKKAPPTTMRPKTDTTQSHRSATKSMPIEDKLLLLLLGVVIVYVITEACR